MTPDPAAEPAAEPPTFEAFVRITTQIVRASLTMRSAVIAVLGIIIRFALTITFMIDMTGRRPAASGGTVSSRDRLRFQRTSHGDLDQRPLRYGPGLLLLVTL